MSGLNQRFGFTTSRVGQGAGGWSVGALDAGAGADPWALPAPDSAIVAHWTAEFGLVGGSSIASWEAYVGGQTVEQATGGFQPTLVQGATPSGKPAVRFDGTDDFLRMASFDLSTHQDIDLWVVTVRSVVPGSIMQIVDHNPAVRTVFFSFSSDRATFAVVGNVGNDSRNDSDTTLLDSWRTHNLLARVSAGAGNEARGFFDEALTSYDTQPSTANNTDADIGSGELTFGQRNSALGDGNNYGGDIAMIAYLVPGAYDRGDLAAHLSSYYGTP